ncbi:MAG: hypothetical protein NT068_01040 [Candidatus Nomurabacteria bacterium]|nr:hypothetical protein [Candidatus Nomurabacteria bacterium]
MKKNTKAIIVIIPILFLVIFSYRYYQYIIQKNYILEVNTICNSEIENCFDSSDLSFGQNPYKKVRVLDKYAPKCLEEHNCDSFYCPVSLGKDKCEITYCSDETKVDGEGCTNKIITNQ